MSQHVIVAGGGIVGCLTALELAERGCRVTVVERGEIASQRSGEASWAGAGILFPLLPWMYAEAVNQLTLTGASLYPALCERLLAETGIDPEFQRSGMGYALAEVKAHYRAKLQGKKTRKAKLRSWPK